MSIFYKAGYKYQLVADYTHFSQLTGHACRNSFCSLEPDGQLLIHAGYAWDGPSGPTIDTRNFMRGSLIHDALYQFLREGQLPADRRKEADQELDRCLKQDGMSAARRWWVYTGLRWGGAAAADGADAAPVLEAP